MKLKRLNRTIASVIAALLLVLIPAASTLGTAYAACPSDSSAKAQVLQGLGATGSDCSGQQVNSLFAVAVDILSIVVGVVAVIVVIVSAFKYMTSGGDQNKVSNAKSTLLYALVGVAVAGLAQLMIHFVLYRTTHL